MSDGAQSNLIAPRTSLKLTKGRRVMARRPYALVAIPPQPP